MGPHGCTDSRIRPPRSRVAKRRWHEHRRAPLVVRASSRMLGVLGRVAHRLRQPFHPGGHEQFRKTDAQWGRDGAGCRGALVGQHRAGQHGGRDFLGAGVDAVTPQHSRLAQVPLHVAEVQLELPPPRTQRLQFERGRVCGSSTRRHRSRVLARCLGRHTWTRLSWIVNQSPVRCGRSTSRTGTRISRLPSGNDRITWGLISTRARHRNWLPTRCQPQRRRRDRRAAIEAVAGPVCPRGHSGQRLQRQCPFGLTGGPNGRSHGVVQARFQQDGRRQFRERRGAQPTARLAARSPPLAVRGPPSAWCRTNQ